MHKKYVISNKRDFVNEFGGSHVVLDVLQKQQIKGIIDEELGQRNDRAEYKYSEGIISWHTNLLCGGNCLEDMHLIREHIYSHPEFLKERQRRWVKGISPDTFSKMCKELVEENETFDKKSYANALKQGKNIPPKHEINFNRKLNRLLLRLNIKLGLIKRNCPYVLDFDTTTLEHKIKGGRKIYDGHGSRGYSPAMASINDIPIYIENRNGDTPSQWNIKNTIEKILDILEKQKIKITTVRIDAAGYRTELLEFLESKNLQYVTRARRDKTKKEVTKIEDDSWEVEEIRNELIEIAELPYLFGRAKTRLIVTHNREDGKYWALTTNIKDKSKKDIVLFYNMRSGKNSIGEHIFHSLKSDFLWKNLPFRRFDYNSVFILISAICHCLYKFTLRLFQKKIKTLGPNIELKKFINQFIKGQTKWIRKELRLISDTARKYYGLIAGYT